MTVKRVTKGVLSEADYREAVRLYELGDIGVTEIAALYKCSRQNIWKRFHSNGIKRGPGSKHIVEEMVKNFTNQQGEWIEETRLNGYQALRQIQLLSRKIAFDAVKAGKPLGSVDDDLRAIGRLNKIMVDNISATLNLLQHERVTDPNSVPTLTIEDLTDEDIVRHHIDTGAMDEGSTIEDYRSENQSEAEDS